MALAGLGIGGIAFGLSVLGLNYPALVRRRRADRRRRLFHRRLSGACPAHAENPALDLTLFRLPTFFASITGGFIFRLGIGALPFLLPLMLQIGFGMTPFQSGLITFVSAPSAPWA